MVKEALEELAESIRTVGLLQEPTLVRKGERYEVVIGHRRVMAARMAGLQEIPAKVAEPEELDADLAKFHENVYREDISPFEEARWLKRVKDKYGWNNEELAARIGRSAAWVSKRLRSLDWPDFLKEAVNDKVVSFDVAAELYTLPDEREQRRLLQYAIEQGATATLVRDWVRQAKRDLRTKKVIEEVLQQHGRQVTVEGGPAVPFQEVERQVEEWGAQPGPKTSCSLCAQWLPEAEITRLQVCPDCLRILYDCISNARYGEGEHTPSDR